MTSAKGLFLVSFSSLFPLFPVSFKAYWRNFFHRYPATITPIILLLYSYIGPIQKERNSEPIKAMFKTRKG